MRSSNSRSAQPAFVGHLCLSFANSRYFLASLTTLTMSANLSHTIAARATSVDALASGCAPAVSPRRPAAFMMMRSLGGSGV